MAHYLGAVGVGGGGWTQGAVRDCAMNDPEDDDSQDEGFDLDDTEDLG